MGKVGGLVYATTHNLPPIMAFNVHIIMPVWYTNLHKSPYRWRGTPPATPPPPPRRSVAFPPLFWPPLTNPVYTTVTGVAKGGGHGAIPPLIGALKNDKRGKKSRGLIICHYTIHNLPPNNDIYKCKRGDFDSRIFKKSPYIVGGGEDTPCHTLPPLGRFAPSLWPPLTNHGYCHWRT